MARVRVRVRVRRRAERSGGTPSLPGGDLVGVRDRDRVRARVRARVRVRVIGLAPGRRPGWG